MTASQIFAGSDGKVESGPLGINGTAIWNIDPLTGETTRSGADYVQSFGDIVSPIRRSGARQEYDYDDPPNEEEDGTATIQGMTLLASENTTPMMVSNGKSKLEPFTGDFHPGTPWAYRNVTEDELLFQYQKVRFKFRWKEGVAGEQRYAIKYLELFQPEDDPDTQESESVKNAEVVATIDWNGQAEESQVFTIDPDQRRSGVDGSYRLLLVELKQLNYPTTIDTTDLGPTQSKIIGTDQVAYITGVPEMPQLEAHISGDSLLGMTVEWKIEVKSERTERETKDNFTIPETGMIEKPIGEVWKIYESFTAPHGFFGGKARVFYRIKKADGGYLTDEQEIGFKIRGKNPKDVDAKSYIQSALSAYRFAWAIAQHETRDGQRIYNQFNCKGSLKELPFFGGPDGWGLFQIDRSSESGETTTKEVYSWEENVSAGQSKLNQKKSDAERFIRWIRNLWGSDSRWEEPPVTWTISSSQFTPIELATIVLYNGAHGVPWSSGKNDNGGSVTFRSPWSFDPNKPSGQRWTFHDNTNPVSGIHYATAVIEDEWEGELSVAE